MLLLCYAVARATENKKAGTSRVVFLIELNSCKEGKKGRMSTRDHLNTQTQQARRYSQAFGKTVRRRFRDISVLNYRACNSNSHTLLQNTLLNRLRTCTVGILVEKKGSQFLENDLTSDEIYSNDLLNGFTEGEHLRSSTGSSDVGRSKKPSWQVRNTNFRPAVTSGPYRQGKVKGHFEH